MLIHEEFSFPLDLFYHRTNHIWVCYEDDVVRLGLDALAVDSFGDIAYVSLSPVGTAVEQGRSLGSIEAAKMVDDLFAPVSGMVKALNEVVLQDPSAINRDPYDAGWLVQLKVSPETWERECADLVYGEDVPAWATAEAERLRE